MNTIFSYHEADCHSVFHEDQSIFTHYFKWPLLSNLRAGDYVILDEDLYSVLGIEQVEYDGVPFKHKSVTLRYIPWIDKKSDTVNEATGEKIPKVLMESSKFHEILSMGWLTQIIFEKAVGQKSFLDIWREKKSMKTVTEVFINGT